MIKEKKRIQISDFSFNFEGYGGEEKEKYFLNFIII